MEIKGWLVFKLPQKDFEILKKAWLEILGYFPDFAIGNLADKVIAKFYVFSLLKINPHLVWPNSLLTLGQILEEVEEEALNLGAKLREKLPPHIQMEWE